jgi:hypothetical protein
MENLIFYTDRYQAINLIEDENFKIVNIHPPLTAELDLFISNEIIDKELDKIKFKNIYIPLSPFSSFTDYLGLHIAIYIKLSKSKNKLSNIYIYGCDDVQNIIKNNYVEVLKFKEVTLIDFSKESILITSTYDLNITEDIWFKQINNIQIPIPEDYIDNHSIANEWGIYQLARNADIDIKEIDGIDLEKLNKLYFKWLIFKNKLNEPISEEQKVEQKRYAEKLKGPTILGNIDLSKMKKK